MAESGADIGAFKGALGSADLDESVYVRLSIKTAT